MSLIYKFKKEKLEDGTLVSRPRILVALHGSLSIEIPALIDSGCDITVIPESLARAVGLDFSGEKTRLYAYREATEVILSKANITFLGKAQRQSVRLTLPVLIALSRDNTAEENDITLGIQGIFDAFDITFLKSQNKIIFKQAQHTNRFLFF